MFVIYNFMKNYLQTSNTFMHLCLIGLLIIRFGYSEELVSSIGFDGLDNLQDFLVVKGALPSLL